MELIKNIIGENEQQRAILVGIEISNNIDMSIIELEELSKACDLKIIDKVIQKREKIDSSFYIGKGKVYEIKAICDSCNIGLVIFNDELTGVQIRNLENVLEVEVIDRTNLILHIFAKRATSKEGKLQVELAQLQYRLPRLIGLGKSLSRTGAGIGTRGPGEKKLETDRRHILRRIEEIKKEIKEAKKIRETQRSKRLKNEIPLVALVGYTNAGKSSLMNKLLEISNKNEKAVFVKDMLFATLDTYQRKIKLSNNQEFILIDTVGFVSKLPHMLVNAFKGTLEEVVYADLLIHVVDVSSENYEFQINVTEKVLKEIGAKDKQKILLLNKIDKIEYDTNLLKRGEDILYLSVKDGKGIDELLDKISEKLFSDYKKVSLLIPYDKGDIVSLLCDKTNIIKKDYKENGIYIETVLGQADVNRYKRYIKLEQ